MKSRVVILMLIAFQVGISAQVNLRNHIKLYGYKFHEGNRKTKIRTLPFEINYSINKIVNSDTFNLETNADALYLSGMITYNWDKGQAGWWHNPELENDRNDQQYFRKKVGWIEINYENQTKDEIPLIIGATIWFAKGWAYQPSHSYNKELQEPFAARPEYMKIFRENLLLKETDEQVNDSNVLAHYYLAIKPRNFKIKNIIVCDDKKSWGKPFISGITLANASNTESFTKFENNAIAEKDLEIVYDVTKNYDLEERANKIAKIICTSQSDLPSKVAILKFPGNLKATSVQLSGISKNNVDYLGMINNMWVANLIQINEKMETKSGFMQETCKDCPFYGGYEGIGTWAPAGIYFNNSYARTSDHMATIGFRYLNNKEKPTSYIDFVDRCLYFYRNNHDTTQGPPNNILDTTRYPVNLPHWGMEMTNKYYGPEINELWGNEEMDGHGTNMIGRWFAWNILEKPMDKWLTEPRKNVYNKSRWQSTKDAADYVCWLMDYTGQDLIWSEGEINGWGLNGKLVPGMKTDEKDIIKIKENYKIADMYELYPSLACMIGLQVSAEMADSLGKHDESQKWRKYASKIEAQIVPGLTFDSPLGKTWRYCKKSVWPSRMESLAFAFLSIYKTGIDTKKWDTTYYKITYQTYLERLNQKTKYAPVLGLGYGLGWLTQSAFILDKLDDASDLLYHMAKFSYDKNMNYYDIKTQKDWRKWLWIFPEGTNILPDSSWYRIGDLSNGANQGIAMHAIESCIGLDDTKRDTIKIMPRLVDEANKIEVENLYVLTTYGISKIDYQYERCKFFSLESNKQIRNLSLRIGPFSSEECAKNSMKKTKCNVPSIQRIEKSGTSKGENAWWIWLENIKNAENIKIRVD